MTCEAASALGVSTVVLAAREDDAAVPAADRVVMGAPADRSALEALVALAGVVTFDHEQVDLDALAALERRGVAVRPGVETLRVAVDKAEMRTRLSAGGVPVPRYKVLGRPGARGSDPRELATEVAKFAACVGWPVVLKATRGGYDGRGVFEVADDDAALAVCERAARAATPLLVEEHVDMEAELAAVVARAPDGRTVAWPPVETAQVEGMCREVRYPGTLAAGVAEQAAALGSEVARIVGATGVLAVELFAVQGRLVVNEIAARPHNSAHWTIEGAVTSQFENHVRAVLGLPLGESTPRAPHVVSVNVLGAPAADEQEGADPQARLADALAVPGAHVHLYGKAPRPGRKLGHVTVCGDDPAEVRGRAWAAARALGTPVPASIASELP